MKFHLEPKYVLDEMEWYEINAIMKNQHYAISEDWEQTRFISYLIAQTNSKKKLKLDDIMKFYWQENQNDEVQEVKKEDVNRLQRKAEYIQNLLKQKENGKVD